MMGFPEAFKRAMAEKGRVPCSGRTTRLMDYYVQELFTHGHIAIRDHHNMKSHVTLFHRVLARLHCEHPGTDLEVDSSRLEIYLQDRHINFSQVHEMRQGGEVMDALERLRRMTTQEEAQHRWLRCTGRTTRLIDYYVQELFTRGYVTIRDHFDQREYHERLFRRVMDRLSYEHPGVAVEVDPSRLEIYLQERFDNTHRKVSF